VRRDNLPPSNVMACSGRHSAVNPCLLQGMKSTGAQRLDCRNDGTVQVTHAKQA
jgi:hypothetical protein